jgi:CBS domain containing-hemolysin-like protein
MLLAQNPVGLDPALRSMLVRIFDLRRRTARHVMSLRVDAATLRAHETIAEAVKKVSDAGYSRYPVLDEEGKQVLGYIHLRDLFEVLSGRRRASRVAELLRKPIFAREDTSVERLRRDMQATQTPVAVIRSQQGEFVGLVTMEDLLEEIVGEIRDENDDEVAPIHRRGGGLVDVDGRVLLQDLERDAGVVFKPSIDTIETVGGYILARLHRPASQGERVECEGYTLVVTDVAGRRVRRVRIVPAAPSADALSASEAKSGKSTES